ncbi:mitochondrial ribosomal protein-like protein subunit L51 [Cucurbitaria berberidis CBS 394.84]|uniref:Large ribosomal subunit protein mL43 n=1 Tax=Cucurbitaria berberidis CBS 394.84 TaxID=1168544 RepID=A0A9P4GL90_9PLEO|nr:mitochondrial ribosomal protein-like protein subunit L51 [Cucurbitaria berberidis CBS 394.84]KAF1847254.1 mitochondrial ribosomal protein-like protein subunit L51 [Cucurbitaria berberidis CBS 394.84]
MPLSAIKTVAKAQNGVGAFVLQCKRLDFHYCNWWGSSHGMNTFIKSSLPSFAKRNPQVEFSVSPRPRKHPVIIAHYINGTQRSICVKNLQNEGVREKAELLRDSNGEKNRKIGKPVASINESVRGIWDPFHGAKINI